jgi:hypothetical protein
MKKRGSRNRETALCLFVCKSGADEGIRTPDLRITNAPLYQLSYSGEGAEL